MKLLIIGLNFSPEPTGIGKYTGDMAEWLAARGHQVRVITAPPYYPSWSVDPRFKRFTWQREGRSGCKIVRCPIYVPTNVTGAKRLIHLLSFAASCAPAALVEVLADPPDVVAAVAPTLFSAPIALAAARLVSAKTWLHIQDLEIEAAFELGILNGRRIAASVLAGERQLLKRFDLVSSISPRMLDAIERKGISDERLFLLPNWVDLSRIVPLAPSKQLRRKFGLPEDRAIVLYAGSMGLKQGLETVIAAAKRLALLPNAPMFVLAGDGPARASLERLAAPLANVTFFPLQPEDRFNEFLSSADLHILPQRADAADLVMPSKLIPMLASGRPVVATAVAGTQIATTIGSGGAIVPPGDDERLAFVLRGLLESPDTLASMGQAARHAAAQFDRRRVLGQLEQRLLNVGAAS